VGETGVGQADIGARPAPDPGRTPKPERLRVVKVLQPDNALAYMGQCYVAKQGVAYKYFPDGGGRFQDDEVWDAANAGVKIPVWIARLGLNVEGSGKLHLKTKAVGRLKADAGGVRRKDVGGFCPGATHIIVEATLGAFDLYQVAEHAAGAKLSAFDAGAEGGYDAGRVHHKSGGDFTCASTAGDTQAPLP
jgi:hypothetical protein